MQKIILSFIISVSFLFSFAQNTSSLNVATQPTVSEAWCLHKYVWSHDHYRIRENDKAVIDFEAIDNWENVNDEDLSISPNGSYFAYGTFRGHAFWKEHETMVVKSTTNSWQHSFEGATPGFFSADSRQYIFKQKDNLCFLQVGSEQPRCVKSVASYKQPTGQKVEWVAYQLKNPDSTLVLEHLGTGMEKRFKSVSNYEFDAAAKWLVCQLKGEAKELLIYNLATGKEQHFQSVVGYAWKADGKILVLKTIEKVNNEIIIGLKYANLPEGTVHTIWSTTDNTETLGSYSIDESGNQVVFTMQHIASVSSDKNKLLNNSIWYWRNGMDKAVMKVNNQTVGIDAGLSIQGPILFTDNSRYVQFLLQQPAPDLGKPAADAIKVDVWSYQDSFLQSTQPYLLKQSKTYKAVLDPQAGQVIRLEKEHEKLHLLKGDFAVITKSGKDLSDRFWEEEFQRDSSWLVSLQDGSRQLLKARGANKYSIWFSPAGNYLVYSDPEQGCHYFSYNLHTGKLVKISTGIPDWQLGYVDRYIRSTKKTSFAAGIADWMQGDSGLLVYDDYDIWQLDLTGKKPPLNITNGYGRKHKILFSFINTADRRSYYNTKQIFAGNDTLILKAFNRQTKYNGFYRKVLGSTGDPELLDMGPYFFQSQAGLSGLDGGMQPLKAADADTWIVKRQSATEAPNYFLTRDFKNYRHLTDLQSQKGYNWLTAELHSFKQLDGTISQGVLYKPENFEPNKKYPVIISFYTYLSDQLYQYPKPENITNPAIFLNPAWMVAHGYLVFTPDIYFTQAQWGPSTMNTIEGAAKYLSQLPFVDTRYLGACGHSNSGRLGYYLLTHSKSFAAMSIGAGSTNIISAGLSLQNSGEEESELEWVELGSIGTGLGNLWQHKASWIDHTSVLQADKVISPVLMFHNKKDGAPVEQAVQMFISLRRLHKKAWWLQYDDGYHGVIRQDAKDFTIRYTQFFDHYLKGAPEPRWMTQGIPYQYKGIESRYELDAAGHCSMAGKTTCAICEAWNKQYKRNPAMFEKPISEWKLDKDIEMEMNKKETERHQKDMVGEAQRVKENNDKLKGVWKGEHY
jgi:dienelactone hydrolase